MKYESSPIESTGGFIRKECFMVIPSNNNNNNTNIYRGRPQSLESAFHEGLLFN